MNAIKVEMEATHLSGRQWAVRPVNQLGTMGWSPVAWTVQYVQAGSEAEAVAKARPLYHK